MYVNKLIAVKGIHLDIINMFIIFMKPFILFSL